MVFGNTLVAWLFPWLSQNCYFCFLWHPLSAYLHHLLLATHISLYSHSSMVVSLSLRLSSSARFSWTRFSLQHWGVSTAVITGLLSCSNCLLQLGCTGYMTIWCCSVLSILDCATLITSPVIPVPNI